MNEISENLTKDVLTNAQIQQASVPEEVQLIVDALDDKRAKDITVLDLRSVSESLDYFVIATGESGLQLGALEDSVKMKLKEHGYIANGIEGPPDRWLLIDYVTVIAHVMSPEARDFYDLESLWADAERVEVIPN